MAQRGAEGDVVQSDVERGSGPAIVGIPFPDFSTASNAVLQLLEDRIDLGLWMVTRQAGPDQVVLAARNAPGSGYEVSVGAVLPWADSLCVQLVSGHGPAVAPRVGDVPAYADAPNRQLVPIEAYMAVPLRQADGEVFGTLCGFAQQPQPESLHEAEALVVLQARLLATVLNLQLQREELERRAERAETEAHRDVLTGLANRRAWDTVLAAEEARCRRYGHPAAVVVVDLNGLKTLNDSSGHAAGDQLLRDAAAVLHGAARETDLVARLGGDEFGVLALETDGNGGHVTAERLRRALRDHGVAAAVGVGVRSPQATLAVAWQDADRAMYEDKRSGKGLTPQ